MDRQQTWIGLLATLMILVVLVTTALREPVRQIEAAELIEAEAIAEGTLLYAENCVICHGASGEGLAAFPPLAMLVEAESEDLYKTIERGRYNTSMAAYGVEEGGIFTKAQIDSLVTMIQAGDWGDIRQTVTDMGLMPPEMVAVELDEAAISQVEALPDGSTLAAGLNLYAAECTACHAPDGGGTSLAPALNTDELRTRLDDAAISRVIEQGVPGTLMAAWGNALDEQQIISLTALLRRWPEVDAAGISIPVVEVAPVEISPEAIAAGERIFSIACTSCHGSSGYGTPMAPALNNDLFLSTTSDAAIRQIIGMGVSGTIMPAWGGRLNENDINAIIAYLRSFEGNAPVIPAAR